MKKIIIAIGVAVMTAAPQLLALSVTLQQGAYSYGVGGEFVAAGTIYDQYQQYYSPLAKYTGNNGLTGFGTFCLEYNEEFYPGQSYPITHIGNNALWGSVPGVGDPISKGTALLYYDFATGNQTFGYNWGSGRRTSAGQMQATIWWLEGEGGYADPGNSNPFRALVVQTFGSVAGAMTDNDVHQIPVQAMTLGDPGQAQDQLILTGDGRSVPDGGTSATLLSMAVAGVCLLRRKLT